MNTQTTKEHLKLQLQQFLAEFSSFITAHNINTTNIGIDHIGYKCSSSKEYEALRAAFESDDRFVYQSIISRRRIAIIGFHDSLPSICGNVSYLELSDQKPDGSQLSCVDHLELVAQGISYEDMRARFAGAGISVTLNEKPHHTTHEMSFITGKKVKLSREKIVAKIYRDEMSQG